MRRTAAARGALRGKAKALVRAKTGAAADTAQDIPAGRKVDVAALFPGLRKRHDGWTQARTQRFLDTLAYTGCISDAARVSDMSVVSARRMKARFPKFSAAWDRALARAGQGLMAVAYQRAVDGRETIIIRGGAEVERRITPSDAMLTLLLKRGDLAGGGLGAGFAAEDVLTFDEWQKHKRFDDYGRKVEIEDPAETSAKFVAKMAQIRDRLKAYAAQGGTCPSCRQVLPEGWPHQSIAELIAGGIVPADEFDVD